VSLITVTVEVCPTPHPSNDKGVRATGWSLANAWPIRIVTYESAGDEVPVDSFELGFEAMTQQ